MRGPTILITVIIFAAGAALGHQGVTNPAVKARMDNMTALQAETKRLGQMAMGASAFDAQAAAQALQRLNRLSGDIPALFQPREDDPMSEARAEIWQDFPDFEAKARALQQVAASAGQPQDAKALQPLMARIGAACKSCHQLYRQRRH